MANSISMQKNKERHATRIFEILKDTYPNAHCELTHSNPIELLVATILSAQCTDKRVNLVTPALFKRYRTAQDYASAKSEELEEMIRSTGFYKNKARHIMGACKVIAEKYRGDVPQTMEELAALPGIGRKTANVILGTVFGKNEGVVVDTHVLRLAKRFGLSDAKNPIRMEQDLMKLFSQKDWIFLSHLLVWHGRRRCFARNPDCAHCELKKICPSANIKKINSTSLLSKVSFKD